MAIKSLGIVEQELNEALRYYAAIYPSLADKFLSEYQASLRLIERFPAAWHKLSKNTRQCRLNSFPCAVVYAVTGDDILILAVASTHRRPGYWKERLKVL